jgi:hypothetical protein
VKLIWFVVLNALPALGAGCREKPALDEPAVDRSDGKIPELRATFVERGSIKIDGKLDESAWKSSPSSAPFVDPGSGKPDAKSTVQASTHVLWDDERIYFGIKVFDRNPSTPFSRDDVDPHVWASASGVEIMLQPGDFSDNRDYFEVQVDSVGAVWDTRFDDYNRPITGGPDDATKRFGHQEWLSRIERATSVEPGSYTVEASIPFAALMTSRVSAAPSAGAVWRANFYSFRDGQAAALAWSPILGQGNFHKTSRFGRLSFTK